MGSIENKRKPLPYIGCIIPISILLVIVGSISLFFLPPVDDELTDITCTIDKVYLFDEDVTPQGSKRDLLGVPIMKTYYGVISNEYPNVRFKIPKKSFNYRVFTDHVSEGDTIYISVAINSLERAKKLDSDVLIRAMSDQSNEYLNNEYKREWALALRVLVIISGLALFVYTFPYLKFFWIKS